jgi:hypothetical protein
VAKLGSPTRPEVEHADDFLIRKSQEDEGSLGRSRTRDEGLLLFDRRRRATGDRIQLLVEQGAGERCQGLSVRFLGLTYHQ